MTNEYANSECCPKIQLLEEFVVGNLSDPAACEEIAKHVELCSSCVQRLAQLESNANPLVASLQRGSILATQQAEKPVDDSWHDALQRVLEIGNPTSAKPQDVSTANVAEQTVLTSFDLKRNRDQFDSATIGSYQLIERIGVGGMGIVYRAMHTKLNRLVAIKLLSKDRLGSVQAARRFEREMQAVGGLKHPNIVAGHDAGESDGYFFLAMELLEGNDLSELANQKICPVEIADACELIRQTAMGLLYAHQNGIVHRDVKPSNIMLCDAQSPIVKLLDLGLARFEQPDPTQESMTSINQMMGTIDYMSPEQCLDSHGVDARSDIYSLGATLFRLLVGRAPWADDEHQTQGQKLKALLSDQLPSIAKFRSNLPDELVSIVDRCLKRDPNDRYQYVSAVIVELEPLCIGHDLASLLREHQADPTAPAADSSGKVPPADQRLSISRSAQSVVELPAKTGASAQTADDLPAETQTITNQPTNLTKWLMLGGLPIALLLSGIIWLKTDGGYIRIEADPSIEVSVEVMKDGKTVETVEVGQDKDTCWYRSGQYEIRIADGMDQELSITGESLTITRGSREVVTIAKKAIKTPTTNELAAMKRMPDRSTPLSRLDFSPSELTPYEILTSADWEWTEPENLGTHINAPGVDDVDGQLTADGLTFIASRSGRPVVYTRNSVHRPFDASRTVHEAQGAFAGHPSLSADGRSLFYYSSGGAGGRKLLVATRNSTNEPFGESKSVALTGGGQPVRTFAYDDGKRMVFDMRFPGGQGGFDIWMSQRKSVGDDFDKPVNLGPKVNSHSEELDPCLSTDGQVLIFSRLTEFVTGATKDLWMSMREDPNAEFSQAIRIPLPKHFRPGTANLTPDGRALIFSSMHGPDKRNDLWLIRRVRKKGVDQE